MYEYGREGDADEEVWARGERRGEGWGGCTRGEDKRGGWIMGGIIFRLDGD